MRLAGVALLGLTAAMGAPAFAQEQIGRAAAVVPQAQGTPPEQAARVLQIGLDMFQNERVQTGPEGRAQLLFVDGTALTVGPNSDLVLDEYVYDPDAGSGKIALSATRGVFRIVGGKISKGEPVTLRTPTVTIGVRGGVAFANVGETVSAAFIYGAEMTATGGGRTERTTRNGTEIVTPPNGVPNPPQPLSQATISGSLNAMEGTTGAASAGPAVNDEDVAQSQIAELSSTIAPDLVNPGVVVAPATNVTTIERTADRTIASQVDMVAQANAGGSVAMGSLVGRYKTSAVAGVDDGTGDDSDAFNIPFTGAAITNGQFRASIASSVLTFPVNPDANGLFSFGPSNMTDSAFGPITGTGWISAASDFGFIEYTEDDFPGYRGIAFFGKPAPAAAFAPGVMAYALRDDFVLGGSKIPFIPNSLNGDLGSGGRAYIGWAANPATEDTPFLGGALVVSGQGSAQRWAAGLLIGQVDRNQASTASLEGAMRGSTRRTAASPLSVFFDGPIATSDAGDGSDFFGAQGDFVLESLLVDSADAPVDPLHEIGVNVVENGLTQNVIFPNAISARLPTAPAATRTTRTLFFETAGIAQTAPSVMNVRFGTNEAAPGMLILDGGGGVSVAATASLLPLDGGVPSNTVLRFGEPAGLQQASAFVNDALWAATESATASTVGGSPGSFKGALVSSGLVTLANVLPAGVSLCSCQYVDWGFWGGQVFLSGGARLEFPLVPFAAGAPVVAAQFPASGSAVYSGHAIANLFDGSNNFIAAGGLSVSASFFSGAVSLSADITNLNGNNLTYTGFDSAPGPVTLSLSSATGPQNFLLGSGSLRFAGPGAPPENVYGHFAAQDMTGINRAAGVLMGAR
jgi:hypothetical protein